MRTHFEQEVSRYRLQKQKDLREKIESRIHGIWSYEGTTATGEERQSGREPATSSAGLRNYSEAGTSRCPRNTDAWAAAAPRSPGLQSCWWYLLSSLTPMYSGHRHHRGTHEGLRCFLPTNDCTILFGWIDCVCPPYSLTLFYIRTPQLFRKTAAKGPAPKTSKYDWAVGVDTYSQAGNSPIMLVRVGTEQAAESPTLGLVWWASCVPPSSPGTSQAVPFPVN